MTGSLAFSSARIPAIHFGSGVASRLPALTAELGKHALIVTGAESLRASGALDLLLGGLRQHGVRFDTATISGEPSPETVDAYAERYRGSGVDVVIAVGGGSALDAGKALAGILPFENSVLDHLEGVGRGVPYAGPALPFVAAPTTAGTGSEATKNAVLSRVGHDGFKKSFRHESLVPALAVVDPDLLRTCPQDVLAANAMDALTQLLEAWVSTRASRFTDALALDGLRAWQQGASLLGPRCEAPDRCRANLAYASLASGICLAQAGLGSVHGLASPLGAFFPIPHGVVCGTLVAQATRTNLGALEARVPDSPALGRYALAGRILAGDETQRGGVEQLLTQLDELTETQAMPRLARYGVTARDVPRIVAAARGSSMFTNPVPLTDEELADIVRARM